MAKRRVTQDRLRELVAYDPHTGLFTRLRSAGGVLPGETPEYINRCGHIEFRLDDELYKAHMVAWFFVHGTWPAARLVHSNGVKTDNRIANLGYPRRYTSTPLDADRLRALVVYDPLTGLFTRRIAVANQHVGDSVGCLGKRGYLVANIDGKIQYLHRLAWLYMTGVWPSRKVDHRNRVRTDNRWGNLRTATDAQNASNTARRKPSNTGVLGVYFCTRTQKYVAEVRHAGKRVLCKRFALLADAEAAAVFTRDKYHSAFAVHKYEE
jgi:hypothetical protein